MKLCDVLRNNLDIFAWKPADMTGVPRSIAEHRLSVRKGCPLIRQKRRGHALDQNKAIQEEVAKLMDAQIMREVHYHSWIANPVMVKKHDDSWRMCVKFTDLNKACPKDCYPLPEIEWKIESLCGDPFKCFLDSYKGYHQIQMSEEGEEKTAFHTMYVDDLVIKSHTEQEILKDIEETFHILRKINMKLNPKKCTFGAEEGMFLGHAINIKAIKACLEKAETMIKLQSPRTLKEVQSLNGKLASLNRFLSKSAEKSLPFFKTLKNCIKRVISNGHHKPKGQRSGQCSPTNGKILTENANLFRQSSPASSENKLQLNGKIGVGCSARLNEAKKLEAFDINYRPRTSIRGQVLVDFIAKRPEENGPPTWIQVAEEILESWTLFMDGSPCMEGSRSELILTSPEGTEFTYALRFEFNISNNEAKYEALVAGL
ncbi:reverse transcriptase domain-containing protein [Tanacetum coccineum]